MKFLAVAVFFIAVAYVSAGGIGLPLATSRGALEGALGGKWIPDVPAAHAPLAAPLADAPWAAAPYAAAPWSAAPWSAVPWSAASIVGAPAATIAARTIVAPGLGLAAPALSAKGALEGALGGQWIPDVPAARAPLAAAPWAATPWSAAPWSAASIVGAPAATIAAKTVVAPGLGLAGPVVSAKGALEGALGGQWIPDVLPEH